VPALDGAELAIGQVNAAGGVNGRKFSLTKYDDQCLPTQSAVVAAKIISDPSIIGVIGPVCSTAAEAALPVYARGHVEVVGAGTSAPQLSTIALEHHYTFWLRLNPTDGPQGLQLATLAIKILHKKKIAFLYSSDDYGEGVLQYARPAVKELGGTIVASETYTPTTTKDFTPQLTKIAASGAQAIFLMGYYSDTAEAVSQFARAGISSSVTAIGTDSTAQVGFVPLAGKAANGVYLVPFYWATNPAPANAKFVKAYESKFHQLPNGNSVAAYLAVYAYQLALKEGATQKTLAVKMRALKFTGLTGPVAFNNAGDLKGSPGVVLRVENGKLVTIAGLTFLLERDLAS
jgi:branched-chain amino acid transport system substrate-binding protein